MSKYFFFLGLLVCGIYLISLCWFHTVYNTFCYTPQWRLQLVMTRVVACILENARSIHGYGLSIYIGEGHVHLDPPQTLHKRDRCGTGTLQHTLTNMVHATQSTVAHKSLVSDSFQTFGTSYSSCCLE